MLVNDDDQSLLRIFFSISFDTLNLSLILILHFDKNVFHSISNQISLLLFFDFTDVILLKQIPDRNYERRKCLNKCSFIDRSIETRDVTIPIPPIPIPLVLVGIGIGGIGIGEYWYWY